MNFLVIGLLIAFLIYMIVWTLRFYSHTKRQDKMKRIEELRAKNREKENASQETEEATGDSPSEEKPPVADTPVAANPMKTEEPKAALVDESRDYWYNRIELANAENEKEEKKCYHYIDSVQQCVHDLLLEMYDYALVRIDEIEEIAYGESKLDQVDLSFLKEFEEDGEETVSDVERTPDNNLDKQDLAKEDTKSNKIVDEEVIQVVGMDAVLSAAKKLKENDPVITDIHGTLSDGMEKVLQAVDQEKEIEARKKEPIMVKEKESVEKARENRKKTSSQEIRNQIFMKWDHYVASLYEMVEIHANEDTKRKIKKALRDYGYNDVDVLLKSPD